jgi:hypothetical protein
MSFWNKLGKIALQAAPYVAAPFTGGASLLATGATQKLGQKWAEHDAKKAIEKGIAPSKFDKYLGMASAGAGLGSMAFGGALSNLGKAGSVGAGVGKGASLASIASKATPVAKVGGFAGNLGKIATIGSNALGVAPRGAGMESGSGGWQGQLAGLAGQVIAGRGEREVPRGEEPTSTTLSSVNTARPRGIFNVADALNRGRDQAIINQPFRTGYDTVVQGDDDTTLTHRMPEIYTNYDRNTGRMVTAPPVPEATPIQNRFGDELTPRRVARRRVPVEEEY